MCDGAACAAITSGSAQIAIAGLIELRAVLDSRSAGLTCRSIIDLLDSKGGSR